MFELQAVCCSYIFAMNEMHVAVDDHISYALCFPDSWTLELYVWRSEQSDVDSDRVFRA